MATEAALRRWDAVTRAADRAVTGDRRRILGLVAAGPGPEEERRRLHSLIRSGDTEAAVAYANERWRERSTATRTILSKSYMRTVVTAGRLTEHGAKLPKAWKRGVDWAESAAAQTVRIVGAGYPGRAGDVMRMGLRYGWGVKAIGRLVRGAVGLTPMMVQRLGARAARGESGASLAALSSKWTRDRADIIARTGVIDAMSFGREESWREAEASGRLDLSRMDRVWVAGRTERTCPICMPADGDRVPADSQDAVFRSVNVHRPPAHPRCRCTIVLRRRGR